MRRLLFVVAVVLSLGLCHAGLICVERTGTPCVKFNKLNIKSQGLNLGRGLTFRLVYAIRDGVCTPHENQPLPDHLIPVPGSCQTTSHFGCCCAGTSNEDESFDVCDGVLESDDSTIPIVSSSLKQIGSKDTIKRLLSVPKFTKKPFDEKILDHLTVNPQAPTWMWADDYDFVRLEFNPVMYPVPVSHVDDISSYKLAYFWHHFQNLPFRPLIQALGQVQNHFRHLTETKPELANDPATAVFTRLIHSVINNLYQGIKTYRFIVELGHVLNARFITGVGDHVFANSLIGPDSPLQLYTAVQFNPYQVIGHVDPKAHIDWGKIILRSKWGKEIKDVPEFATDFILICNIDATAWARLYQDLDRQLDRPSMSTNGLSRYQADEVGPKILKEINTRLPEFLAKMSKKGAL